MGGYLEKRIIYYSSAIKWKIKSGQLNDIGVIISVYKVNGLKD